MAKDDVWESSLLMRAPEVARLLNVSPRHWWRMVDAGQAPAGLTLGKRARRWLRSEIEGWISGGCKKGGVK